MARSPMADVIVLLPGITGSVLSKNGKVVWGFSARSIATALFTRGASLREALALPHDDPDVDDLGDGVEATGLMPDLHLLPGVWKIDGYQKVAASLIAEFAVTEGKNFFRFPYDWRRDNRVAARRLARQAHDWLRAWRETSGNAAAKLILVAHSMGGLVSRYYLECLDGWKDTRALVSFGTPYRGSLNALDGIANGLKKGPLELSTVARQFTSMYQLLPVFECYDAGDGKLKRVAETRGIPNLDAEKAAAALKFHREIEAAVEANRKRPEFADAGYKVYPVVGVAQTTSLSARANGQRVTMLETHNRRTLGGDGTVPRISAIPIEMSDDPDAVYAGTKHGSLQNADAVIQHLQGLLSGFDLNLGDFRKPPLQVSLQLDDVYHATDPVMVQLRTVRGHAQVDVSLWRHDDRAPVDTRPIEATDEWRTVEFAPPGDGAYRVTVTGKDVETAEDALVVTASEEIGE